MVFNIDTFQGYKIVVDYSNKRVYSLTAILKTPNKIKSLTEAKDMLSEEQRKMIESFRFDRGDKVNTITKEAALKIAKEAIISYTYPSPINNSTDLIIQEEKTIEKDFGWVFYCTSKKYLETKDEKYLIPGNAPIIVNRDGYSFYLNNVPNNLPDIEKYEERWNNSIIMKWMSQSDKKTPWDEFSEMVNSYQPVADPSIFIDMYYQKKGSSNLNFQVLSIKERIENGKQIVTIRIEKKYESLLFKDGWSHVDSFN